MKAKNTPLVNKINIVIIEDHIIFRNGFVNTLTGIDQRFNILFEASDGVEFIEKLDEHILPDLLITDIRMNRMDGIEVIEWMIKHHPKIPVIVLTMFNENSFHAQLKSLGVQGLMLKCNTGDKIKNVIETVLAGGSYFEVPDSNALTEIFERSAPITKNFNLSFTEKQFADNLCEDIPLKEIADKMHISAKTAERYRASIFLKFGVKSRVGFILHAIKNKFVKLNK